LTTLSSTAVIECLHGKVAASTTTKNGTFSFCGENPSRDFFCSEEDCYMYTRAVAAFRGSGSIHLVCLTHQKFARLCVVKDTMKDNYGRPFFMCSERKNTCRFWQRGDVFEGPRPLCQHGMMCCERKKSQERWSESKQSVLLLSEGRLLWSLRMKATRTSCNQHWHRALQ
jgi:hypothetical protein